jgi:hypothetical protein
MAFFALSAGSAPAVFPGAGEETHSIALHVHGSLSEGDGSMEWHTAMAESVGVDAIWWTDHDWRIEHRKHTRSFDFETAVYDPVYGRYAEVDDAYPGQYRYFERAPSSLPHSISLVDTMAYSGTRSLRISGEDPWGSVTFRSVPVVQTGSRKQNAYSLGMRPKISFALFPEDLDPAFSRVVLQVKLSVHPLGQHVLRYVMGSMYGEGPDTIQLPLSPGVWNPVQVDPAADAMARFSSGGADTLAALDNSLVEVRFALEVKDGQSATVFLDGYAIDPDSTQGGWPLIGMQRSALDLYRMSYPGVSHFQGTEVSLFSGQPHLNAFTPTAFLPDYTGHVWQDSISYVTDQVHTAGGAVSMNHAFGVGIYGDNGETASQKAVRIANTKRWLLQSRIYGADLLEVGYRWRGGIDLAGHVEAWDALSANAVFTTGCGVTDTHGPSIFYGWGPWEALPSRENNFATWFHVDAPDEPGFIRAMKAGRAFFGDPFLFGGTIDLWTPEGFPMGRVVVTDRASHEVVVDVAGFADSASVRLLQLEVRGDPPSEYLDPVVLCDTLLAAPTLAGSILDTVSVDTTVPSFVRVEVSHSSTEAIAFSNPLFLLLDVPPGGIPAERAAAVLGDLSILQARDFLWTAVDASDLPDRFALTGDAGTDGFLKIACGSPGTPSSVRVNGVPASWSFVDGSVLVDGLSGIDTLVELHWGATFAADAPRWTTVTLEPGHPNPFGSGTMIRFGLPDAREVRIDVFDVSGRRVRRLLAERRGAGQHMISWDGTDESGREVANGIYLLVLESEGIRLSSRAVKLR